MNYEAATIWNADLDGPAEACRQRFPVGNGYLVHCTGDAMDWLEQGEQA